ncbi:ParA-like protein [Candidatus Syntrophocurvum alkaliphilum]|uniref:ParA-like protein n=1 Tax=Candidatus Syntrophocurvum alkaliphilum TaxID=2293317 RepID=A0A6I6DCV0_9FIRM|nr:AAA family ATPase [Candidatus Syntrophocurvum alkaliphilum]QGU00412.1 ParA-like protein [Candidatus Syntrophocurvum alkaliphilum]
MAKVISLINLKGGVGKTTLTVALAEFMAAVYGLKVLVIDIDPQTNSTVALIDEHEWKRRNVRGQTLLSVFKDSVNKYPVFSADEAIIKDVSNVGGGIKGLDLLPSSIDLIEFQDEVLYKGKGVTQDSVMQLRNAIADRINEYDMVMIDCPPDLGLFTQNGLLISDYYLIPVVPDILSTYGIPQIVQRINRFKKNTASKISPLGLVVSKYRAQASVHKGQLHRLKSSAVKLGYQRVFSTIIPENNQSAAAMDYSASYQNLQEKYSYNRPYQEYRQLTEEVLKYVKR